MSSGLFCIFFFKQKTAYEMRISDWSSDVCSSDLRPLIVDAIEEARAHGDLSENAEYHAAKERQGQVEATIGDLEDRLSRAQIIDPTMLSGDRIVFGATVTLADEDDKPVRYQDRKSNSLHYSN